MKKWTKIFILQFVVGLVSAQQWIPDLGNGNFKNPIIYADYSDPDLIKVGDDFYMVSSSFNCMPGIPILHSMDLVNWEIINHVYQKLPLEKYDKPVHGQGCWAPSIRYHKGKFYVYFCTPYDGLFMATTDDPRNAWELTHVVKTELWEDPCPLWDDDGNAYLVRSQLCGNDLILHKMSTDGKSLLDNGALIYRDRENDPTIEGPKFLKKNGYYYILAPAGGVGPGWQTVLRSKNIYGPYERKTVLHQGDTEINGPHQGGLVDLESGESWFAHFQELKPNGRIVHLNKVEWVDGWPMMGKDLNNDGIGEPLTTYNMPDVGKKYPVKIPQTTDEFNAKKIGLQWQWHANPRDDWYSMRDSKGSLRLNAVQNITKAGNLWYAPNLLLQKFPSPRFKATTKLSFNGDLVGDKSGLVVMGRKWTALQIVKTDDGLSLEMVKGDNDKCDGIASVAESVDIETQTVYLRVVIGDDYLGKYQYSYDGKDYEEIGEGFRAKEGVWIGAKVGVFCVNPNIYESAGYAVFDWFRVE
ncbi:glycoside hydrolase family 43 protein [Saccharicrinis sp. 156]|uniref:glycoside hydrolase family 43 protein n=1 Tax=Saccharicrinis sp. 156 TaxID=3417574 RepID=UPI003D325D96